MAASPTLVIRILADATQAAKTMTSASGAAGTMASGLRRAVLPATGLVIALGAMGKAAAEDAQGQAVLANSLRKAAGATDAQVAATEDWISKTTLATGIADDQLRPAMATLATATGDVATAQKAMTTVMDTSVATGKDMSAVSAAIAKAYTGNTAALGKLVPGLDRAVLRSGDMNAIMAELARTTGGAAAVAANTAAGRWQRMQVAFAEAKESIGAGLLPVFDQLSARLVTAGTWMANNTGTVTTLAMVLGGLAVAVIGVNAAMSAYTAITTVATAATKLFGKEGLIVRGATMAWTAAQWLLNIALTANPVGLVIVAIAALVAGIVLAWKKSETFRTVVTAAWNAVQAAAVAAWNWIWANAIRPLITAYQQMLTVAGSVAKGIGEAWQALKSVLASVWSWVKSTFIDPWLAAFNSLSGAVEKLIGWINKIKIPKAVQSLIDKGRNLVGLSTVTPSPAPAPAAGGRAAAAPTATTTTRAAAGSSNLPPMVVNVYLDGSKMGGYIDRIVTRRLEAEGARLAAGAWR
jgi:hypothetical protein